MTEYAKVVNGKVIGVIVASEDFISTLSDSSLWVLTPYNGSTGKVGVGYLYSNGLFSAPIPPPAAPLS